MIRKTKLISWLLLIALLLTACGTPQEETPADTTAGGSTTSQQSITDTDPTAGQDLTTGQDPTAGQDPTDTDSSRATSADATRQTTSGGPTASGTAAGTTSRTTARQPGQTQTIAGTTTTKSSCTHVDKDDNGACDRCKKSVMVTVDFYTINDLHGKIADTDAQPGVDELTTYLKQMRKSDDYTIVLSAGDMWQGSSESNLTSGLLTTEWMNEVDFTAMTLGNHEYDWGEDAIRKNDQLAEFPLLAINIYDRATNQRVDYCDASTMVDLGAVQIGIIGAMGDCYSSIAADKCEDVYFVVGTSLTNLVRAEAQRLRQNGADYIVYMLHDGLGQSRSDSVTDVGTSEMSSYYSTILSQGQVDLVFEAHTHQKYILEDPYGVYHLQNRGENKGGLSHVEVSINSVTGSNRINQAELVPTSRYSGLADDPIVEKLLDKYDDQIGDANSVLGYNGRYRDYDAMAQLAADMYYQAGMERWGKQYNIVLGGGFMSVRSPYYLPVGNVTYSQLLQLLPFDNQVVLCSIKGRDLRDKFFETTNDRYFISYGSYGAQVRDSIDLNATYYVVTDTYTSEYKYNRLTEIARLDETTFARDLLAEYIKEGGLE